jgi:hypothetical protein
MLPAFHHETSRRGEPYSSRPGSPTNWPLLASAKSRPEAQKPARLATWSNSNCVKPSLALDSLTDICVGTSRSNSTDLLPRHEVRPSGCVDASCDGIRPTTEWPRALFVARPRRRCEDVHRVLLGKSTQETFTVMARLRLRLAKGAGRCGLLCVDIVPAFELRPATATQMLKL